MSINQIKHLLPEDLLNNMYSIYSPIVVDDILRSYSCKRKTTMRVNKLKALEHLVLAELTENRIKYTKCNWYNDGFLIKNSDEKGLSKLKCYEDGHIYMQNLSSMIPPLYLELKEGLKVLDVSAAPGSKTTQIAAMMKNKGYVLANEINPIRGERLKFNIEKQGAKCVEVTIGDGRELGNRYPEQFDRVLLDAPCGGEGIIEIGTHISFKNWSIANLLKNAKLQGQLLESARNALKRGGILIYSTCTISVEENEEVVHNFITKYRDMRIVEINSKVNHSFCGVIRYKDRNYDENLRKALRIVPNEEMEGFFLCKMVKV